ncbi:uncharacterized protein PAC_01764 [Phialocephala subalpina]|uniref:Transmembrane protein n=1 Tax=Phialocephala subalpina TaxID=576137 RepID=A0A1L7WGM7_9HELO|nr:uncharacterized protein PAC_01764 [Phialocephala subalpina]
MKKVVFLSLMLQLFFHISSAQDSSSATPTSTSSVSLTPQMSASAVSSLYSVLATSSPQQPGSGPAPGDVGSSADGSSGDSNAGAAGTDSSSISISRGGVIAIIVCATFVCVFGVVSAILFYLAKKRDWKVRESIRRSARRVATALTPRSARFPRDIHSRQSRRGLTKIDEVPNTPRNRSADVEKGAKQMSFELTEPPKKSRWERKSGR